MPVLIDERKFRTGLQFKTRIGLLPPEQVTRITLGAAGDLTGSHRRRTALALAAVKFVNTPLVSRSCDNANANPLNAPRPAAIRRCPYAKPP
jgi:hypothetical protein